VQTPTTSFPFPLPPAAASYLPPGSRAVIERFARRRFSLPSPSPRLSTRYRKQTRDVGQGGGGGRLLCRWRPPPHPADCRRRCLFPSRGDSMFPNDNATARGRDSSVTSRCCSRRRVIAPFREDSVSPRFHLVRGGGGRREESAERTDQQPASLLFFLVHNDVIQRAPAGGRARRARGSRQTRET